MFQICVTLPVIGQNTNSNSFVLTQEVFAQKILAKYSQLFQAFSWQSKAQ